MLSFPLLSDCLYNKVIKTLMCAASVAVCDLSRNRISCSLCLTGALAGLYQRRVLVSVHMPASVRVNQGGTGCSFVCIRGSLDVCLRVCVCVCHSVLHLTSFSSTQSAQVIDAVCVCVCGEPNTYRLLRPPVK